MMLAAAAGTVHYDCTITDVSAASATDTGWKRTQPNFPGLERDSWRFAIDVSGGTDRTATVIWDKDLANIAGSAKVLPLAEGVFAFIIAKPGGCLFGEHVCLATVQVGDVGKDKAHVAVTPAGIISAGADRPMDLLQVSLLGSCSRTEDAR
jgi:hypothetical protein